MVQRATLAAAVDRRLFVALLPGHRGARTTSRRRVGVEQIEVELPIAAPRLEVELPIAAPLMEVELHRAAPQIPEPPTVSTTSPGHICKALVGSRFCTSASFRSGGYFAYPARTSSTTFAHGLWAAASRAQQMDSRADRPCSCRLCGGEEQLCTWRRAPHCAGVRCLPPWRRPDGCRYAGRAAGARCGPRRH